MARQGSPEPITSVGSFSFGGSLKHSPGRFSFYVTSDNTAFATGTLVPPSIPAGGISVWRIGDPGWQQTYTPSPNYESWGVTLTSDPSGGLVFVAGVTDSAFGKDTVVIAYPGYGATQPQWVKTYSNAGVNGDDVPVQILTDGAYVYVAGDSDGSLLGSSTGPDFFVIKLDATTGASAWGSQSNGLPVAARWDGGAHGKDYVAEMKITTASGGPGEGVTPPATAYIYVAGTTLETGSLGTDYTVIRVKSDAPSDIIHGRSNLTGNETCTSMAVGGGRVFVTGYATTAATNTVDYVTMSFMADTLLKDPGWPASGATFDGAGGIDQARCIVYSGSDAAVVVTGESWRGASRGFDIATLKLRQTDAIPVWSGLNTGVRFFPTTSTSGDDRPSDMVIDKCGNVYIGGRTLNGASLDFLGLSYKPDDGDLRWLDIDTGNQYITHDGGVDGKDIGAAIRVTVEGGSLVAHDGDVFLFGEVSTGGASSSYGVARFDQLDPCNGDPSCCN